jgi:hypothetical protein
MVEKCHVSYDWIYIVQQNNLDMKNQHNHWFSW